MRIIQRMTDEICLLTQYLQNAIFIIKSCDMASPTIDPGQIALRASNGARLS